MTEVVVPESEDQLVESIYAATLDPAALDATVKRWVERLGNTSIERPNSDAFDAESHLRLAVELLERLSGTSPEDKATPAMAVDRHGVLTSVNDAARAVYGLSVGASTGELPLDRFSKKELDRFAVSCRQSSSTIQKRAFLAQRVDHPGRLLLVLETDRDGFRIRSSEVTWNEQQKALLEASFDLTAAETDIVRLLIEGHGVEDLAQVRNTSVATVRTQIRRIYDKTGAASMPELVRLMVGLSAALYAGPVDSNPTTETVADGAPFPRVSDCHLFVLPDGRRLEYAVFGDRSGHPVLFLHDEICIDGWTAEGVEMLEARHLYVIAPLRPNYGKTDPPPHGSNMPTYQAAEDCLLLLDALGIERVTLLARVLGNMVAMHLLEVAPERVMGLVSIAPPLPMSDADFRALNPLLRMMFFAAKHSSAMARFIVKTRYAFARRYGSRRYLETHYPHPADRKLLEDETVYNAIMHGARVFAASGVEGYLSDIAGSNRYTTKSVASLLQQRVTFVVGECDQNHRRRRVLGVIEQGANADLLVLPAACDLVFYQYTNTILDRVLEYAAGSI